MTKRIELLAPAGNFEKLEIAIHYGADAVYLAGKDFSLRNFSGNFTLDEMKRAVKLAHDSGVKVYVTLNVYARNSEEAAIREYLSELAQIAPDALIVADPGVFMAARKLAPKVDIHVSTQANTTSVAGAKFWRELGATRINTARELSLEEIAQIAEHSGVEVESFVHGAMCISHSGRCLISSFLTDRDSNRGQCSHPCRWNYKVVEEQRPGQYHPVAEDERGTYIFHSKDLCMIDHIPALVGAGIASLKIEGRMKGVSYVATVVKAYREAIDAYYADPEGYAPRPEWAQELTRINHWNYSTGLYFGFEGDEGSNYDNARPNTIHRFAGKIIAVEEGITTIQVRNKIMAGASVEVLPQRGSAVLETITRVAEDNVDNVDSVDDAGGAGGAGGRRRRQEEAFMPESIIRARLSGSYRVNDILRLAEESSY